MVHLIIVLNSRLLHPSNVMHLQAHNLPEWGGGGGGVVFIVVIRHTLVKVNMIRNTGLFLCVTRHLIYALDRDELWWNIPLSHRLCRRYTSTQLFLLFIQLMAKIHLILQCLAGNLSQVHHLINEMQMLDNGCLVGYNFSVDVCYMYHNIPAEILS